MLAYSLLTLLFLLACSSPAFAQCDPSYDQECLGDNDGRGPEISIGPESQTYSADGGAPVTVPVSIGITDADGINASSLSLSLSNANGTLPVAIATYRVGAAGASGLASTALSLTVAGDNVLTAQAMDRFGNAATVRATFKVAVNDPDLPLVFDNVHHSDHRDLVRGAITLKYAMPSYMSLGTERSTGFLYSGELARPTAFVQVDATPDPRSGSRVVAMSLQIIDTATNAPVGRQFYWARGSSVQRMGATWSMSSRPTGAYNYIAVVRSHFDDGRTKESRRSVRVLVVNEAASRYGAGWILAGLQRAYGVANGIIVSEGDGVVRWFATNGCNSERCFLKTPEGDFTTLTYEKSIDALVRVYPDRSRVTFRNNGWMATHSDRFGRTTTYNWQNAVGSATEKVIESITDPAGKVTSFTYSPAGYLQRVVEPGGRTATFRHSGTDLVDIAGPTSLGATYDNTHTVYTYTTEAGTWNASYFRGKLSSITAPAVTVDGALRRRITRFRPAEYLVTLLAEEGTGLENLAPALPTSHAVDETIDPQGHHTFTRPDRYGFPLTIRTGVARNEDVGGLLTEYTWTKDGLLRTVTDESGVTTAHSWNTRGQLLSTTVGENIVYTAAYRPGGDLEFESRDGQALWYSYGPAGEVTRSWYGGKDDSAIHGTTYTYDPLYRLTAASNPTGTRTEWAYNGNAWGNHDYAQQVMNDGVVRRNSFTYDEAGRVRTSTNALNESVTTTYDGRNRVISTRQEPLQLTTQVEYTGASVTRITDATGKSFGFTYNALGWCESETFPDGTRRTYAYDLDGLLKKTTDRRGPSFSIQTTYDAMHRPATRTADGATTTYRYPDKYTMTATNAEGTVTSIHANGAGDRVSSSFAGLPGRLFEVKTVLSAEGWLPAGHDAVAYLNGVAQSTRSFRREVHPSPGGGADMSILDPTGRTTTLHFDEAGHHVQTVFPGGTSQTNAFAGDGRLLHMSFNRAAVNTALGTDYTHDPLGRLSSRTSAAGDARWTYDYDSMDRIRFHEASRIVPLLGCNPSVEYCPTEWSPVRSDVFNYDAADNQTGSGITLQPNTNRYATFGGYTLEYDLAGNLTRRYKAGHEQRLTWNSLGQLTSVTTNGATVTYGYDAANRRVRRTADGQSRYFLYHDGDLLLEINGSGTPVKTYTHLPGTDRPLSVWAQEYGTDAVYYYVVERPGNVRALLSTAGNVAAEYRYTPYGEGESGTSATQPFRFMARELDVTTGLYYVRNRWYDAFLGRFISEDPIGLEGGINTYAYVGNDPVNGRDPSGLFQDDGAVDPCKTMPWLFMCKTIILETLFVTGTAVPPIPPERQYCGGSMCYAAAATGKYAPAVPNVSGSAYVGNNELDMYYPPGFDHQECTIDSVLFFGEMGATVYAGAGVYRAARAAPPSGRRSGARRRRRWRRTDGRPWPAGSRC